MRNVNEKHDQRKAQFLYKTSSLVICLLLIVTVVIGGTVAYIFTKTSEVENTFVMPEYNVEIDEEFSGTVKENVAVEIIGDMEVYVRASVLVSWKDANGNILATAPVENADYQMSMGESSNWFKASDGFYYYKLPVRGTKSVDANGAVTGTSTEILIEKCEVLKAAPKEGYHLAVDILSQVIQATPTEAVVTAWGVTVDANRNISKELASATTKSETIQSETTQSE